MLKTNLDYIIIGLGNKDQQYNMTRHNMGYMILDQMSIKWKFDFEREKFKSLISKVKIFDKKLMFMKPLTYMNNSGQAVIEAVNFYKLPMDNVIVVYDDITLNLGNVKIKKQGTDGGHNGIKDIINLTGSNDFIKIKVGISGKPSKNYKLSDWVLSKFKYEEREDLEKGIDLACKVLESIIRDDVDRAMNIFNKKNKYVK